jgi:hypothetical protein
MLPNKRNLLAGIVSKTVNNYYRLRRMGTQTTDGENYQVGASVALYISGFWYISSNASDTVTFGYGTAAVTDDNSSAPTGVKKFGGFRMGATTNEWKYYPISMMFPASSFPFALLSTGSNTESFRCVLDGVEL